MIHKWLLNYGFVRRVFLCWLLLKIYGFFFKEFINTLLGAARVFLVVTREVLLERLILYLGKTKQLPQPGILLL